MNKSPKWMKIALFSAGVYDILWGAWVVLFPLQIFELTQMTPPNHVFIWKGVGMMIGVIGVANILAAYDPLRHWPLVFAGWLGRVLGAIGFLISIFQGEVNWLFGVTIITNDLIWLPVFSLMMLKIWAPFRMEWVNFHMLSFRRKPESTNPLIMDPDFRRDDTRITNSK